MIQKFLPIRVFCLVLLMTAGALQLAANPGIALTLLNYTVQNNQGNVDLGRSITINALVTNNSSVAFSGTLDFGLHNNTQNTLGTNDNVFQKPPFTSSQINLDPGESVPAIFSINIETPYFEPGPDVVVVWPISSSTIDDSIRIALIINGPNAVNEEREFKPSYIVLRDKIVILDASNQSAVEQVRIYNLMGQQVLAQNGDFITDIPVSTLPKGLYLCQLVDDKNKGAIIRFVH
jgi:hypothetical protein